MSDDKDLALGGEDDELEPEELVGDDELEDLGLDDEDLTGEDE